MGQLESNAKKSSAFGLETATSPSVVSSSRHGRRHPANKPRQRRPRDSSANNEFSKPHQSSKLGLGPQGSDRSHNTIKNDALESTLLCVSGTDTARKHGLDAAEQNHKELQAKNRTLKERNQTLQTKYETSQAQVHTLRARVHMLQEQIQTLKHELQFTVLKQGDTPTRAPENRTGLDDGADMQNYSPGNNCGVLGSRTAEAYYSNVGSSRNPALRCIINNNDAAPGASDIISLAYPPGLGPFYHQVEVSEDVTPSVHFNSPLEYLTFTSISTGHNGSTSSVSDLSQVSRFAPPVSHSAQSGFR